MHVTKITLENFRCFETLNLTIDKPIVLISGSNGTGKTALAEALYYGCYARSFRTYTPRELIKFDHQHALIKLQFINKDTKHSLQIGMNAQKKVIKLNERSIASARQLLQEFPVIVTSELDMQIISGGPAVRRTFIDHFLLLSDNDYLEKLQRLHTIAANRSALLQKTNLVDPTLFKQWTKALWNQSLIIQDFRIPALETILCEVAFLAQQVNLDCLLHAQYNHRVSLGANFDDFWQQNMPLFVSEQRQRRSLFGAHLDDIIFTFNDKPARLFASRGQQKLSVIMLKGALARILVAKGTQPALFFDDIMMDFDDQRLSIALKTLTSLNCQLFITCAQHTQALSAFLGNNNFQHFQLD